MKRIQQPSMQEAEQASLNHEILNTWRPGETLGEHMERRGVSRREFNKWCLKMISLMGVATVTGGISNAQEIADKMAALKRPVVIWLQLQECTGCLESTIRSYNEEIGDMVLSAVSMPYVELLMAPSANQALEDAIREPHILVINGSVPVNDGGVYCTVAGDTVENMLRHCAENASHILAVGSCAYFGSIQAARPNPTGAVGIRDILTDRTVINVPGCPPIGDVITAVIMYILTFDRAPECDLESRPHTAPASTIIARAAPISTPDSSSTCLTTRTRGNASACTRWAARARIRSLPAPSSNGMAASASPSSPATRASAVRSCTSLTA